MIRLVGAVNETVGVECVLSAIGRPPASVGIGVEDFVGATATIERSAVRMYRHYPVTIERFPRWYVRTLGPSEGREFPDALVPLGNMESGAADTLVVAAGTNLPVYIEVRIPKDARPETYHSAIVLRTGENETCRAPIELVVRDVFLSPEDALPVVAGVQLGPILEAQTGLDPRNIGAALDNDGARGVMREAFELLHEHGLSPYTNDVRPRALPTGEGGAMDWESYDRFCGPLIDGTAYGDGRAAHAWPLPVDVHQPDPAQYEGLASPSYRAALRAQLAEVHRHFKSAGWLEKSYLDFDYPPSVNPSAEEYERFRGLASPAKGLDPRPVILSRLIPQPMGAFGWFDYRHEELDEVVGIWATPARYEHAATLASLRSNGKRTWMLPDRPPYSGSLGVEAPPVHARSLAWQAFLRGHEAILLPKTTDWPATILGEPIADSETATDTWLIYPGKHFGVDGFVPSVRLKQLQIGLQEYQYLRLLEENGRAETARLLAASLIQASGTDAYGDHYQDGVTGRRVDDPEVWEQARALLTQETALALAEEREDAVDSSLNLMGWARFLGATRRLEARVESARVSVDPRTRQPKYLVTFDVAIRSSLRTSIEGELSFGGLPAGARAIKVPARVGPVQEWGMVKRAIAYETTELPPRDLDGHFRQTIVFDAGASGRVQVEGVVSVVAPVKAARPILMDGRLDDWGPGESNVAGDFRLVDDQAPRPRAERQTVAYFCYAGDYLYVGVRAAVPPGATASAGMMRRNIVEYEDLTPVGEDLVEILLDPTGAGTLSDDLYHIVIKSTGDLVVERGVGVTPPIGRTEPWAGKRPDYAVSISDDGWTAEIAIPISSLGPQAARSRVWGINLARMEPQRGEYSDWARAPRHCYDARSLGNLIWPE
ncbi:MAG TPA: glycoside hydrolase domain-containing protein [Phycisphaerae bacterium]|nr:glycoside hydrolase domain-containing protein [Phycisphaerae bacterium]